MIMFCLAFFTVELCYICTFISQLLHIDPNLESSSTKRAPVKVLRKKCCSSWADWQELWDRVRFNLYTDANPHRDIHNLLQLTAVRGYRKKGKHLEEIKFTQRWHEFYDLCSDVNFYTYMMYWSFCKELHGINLFTLPQHAGVHSCLCT